MTRRCRTQAATALSVIAKTVITTTLSSAFVARMAFIGGFRIPNRRDATAKDA